LLKKKYNRLPKVVLSPACSPLNFYYDSNALREPPREVELCYQAKLGRKNNKRE
jgi:hypothetical protein